MSLKFVLCAKFRIWIYGHFIEIIYYFYIKLVILKKYIITFKMSIVGEGCLDMMSTSWIYLWWTYGTTGKAK